MPRDHVMLMLGPLHLIWHLNEVSPAVEAWLCQQMSSLYQSPRLLQVLLESDLGKMLVKTTNILEDALTDLYKPGWGCGPFLFFVYVW